MRTEGLARVVLAVSPTLLAETLARALADHGDLEVVICLDLEAGADAAATRPTRYDVGVVTDELPEGIDVEVLIRLPGPATGGLGRVRTGGGERDVILTDVDAVRRLIDDVRPRREAVGN